MKPGITYLSIIILSGFLSCGVSAQENSRERFNEGASLYSAGNYEGALKIWIDIYNSGLRSSNLDYNIGNAYFKLNNVPRAILFFERAWLLKPSDENINYNLEVARTLTVDRFQEIPVLFFVKWYDYISLIFHVNIWASLSITTFILCLVFLSIYIYSSAYSWKVSGFWLAICFFIISAASLAFSLRNKNLIYDSHKAIIISPLLSGKSAPDTSGTDLFVLHEGTKVSIDDEVGDWYEIRLSDGNKGWVPVNSLDII